METLYYFLGLHLGAKTISGRYSLVSEYERYFLVGITDSNTAELWAIEKVVKLCKDNHELRGRNIAMVSDSKVAVVWVNREDFGNMAHINSIYDIRTCMSDCDSLEAVYDSRAYNSFTDSLEKMGSSRTGDFVMWGDL
ncbi:hypothetical protein Ddye_028267 [Dipteronia dyeriana]|uniref:Uncharacterized protein n=1 Tax=Dipteronia dyeriana TaxID=168575 RepID=A0AAD9WS62_9ROSI|nr:hypothetical protein Ddye_028267 [Dipteronia dyeriana]